MTASMLLDDKFWIDALSSDENASIIIGLFYEHALPLSEISPKLPTEVLTDSQIYDIMIKVLLKTSNSQILDIIRRYQINFEIKKADICQFSSFDDCYYRVTNLVIRSGIEGIDWERMGFLLREKPRSKVADTKYGENHGKTAVQLGLCHMDKKHHFWATGFGRCFDHLSKENKDVLKPKLCLYIPIIQNYFVSGLDEGLMASYFDLLKPSTRKRRKPNVSKLIDIVKESL